MPNTETIERTSQDELETMLVDINNRESKLSDWELSFVNDISLLIAAKAGIHENLDAAFTEIWNRVTE